ncbi:MAG: helix-turn-helix domain-containing protein [Spirillospora sp.]
MPWTTSAEEAPADDLRGSLLVDTTALGPGRDAFEVFRSGWESQVGGMFPLPSFTLDATGDFRTRARASRVLDAVITDTHGASAVISPGERYEHEEVRMYVVRRGGWTLDLTRGRGETVVPAGRFGLWRSGRPMPFVAAPDTKARVLSLPSSPLGPLLGDRKVTGPADAAEVRVLMAHAAMVHESLDDLSPAGIRAANNALIELAGAVAARGVDDTEPALAHALVRAAQDIADGLLTDPELSPPVLARELNVSVRTLHRAFATADESVAAYIRRRRLEQARLALSGRLTVSEVAAHWQFADSSHFIRTFKLQYGETPAQYARSNKTPPPTHG